MKPLFTTIALAALGLSFPALSAAPVAAQPLPRKLDLKDAIGFALENNFAIRQARERIRQQEGVEIQVKARQIPNLSASSTYTGNTDEISSYSYARDRYWTIALQAKQVLFAGGGVQASVKNARLTREAAVLELQGVINQELLSVRTRFFNLLLAKERIGVQEENLKLLQQQLRDARSRLEAGTVSNFEVLRAEVSVANGQPPLIQARNDYRIAIEQLRQSLGAVGAGDGTPEFRGSLEVLGHGDWQLQDAIAAARSNRPELKRLARLEEAGEQNVRSSRSAYMPEFDAIASYTWLRGTTSTSWPNRRDGWTAGLQAQWNIFDGRATAGRVAQARSQLAQARLSLDEANLAIEVQVRQAYSSFVEAWELVQASGKTVEQAQEALRLANVRYAAGTATQLDVLTSQVALTDARLNQLQAGYGYHVALAALREAVGQADEFVSS